jgi:SWI/SNF-related matrix-associated actin-dependent regulator 1 of chromatin subfamily A
MEDLGLQGPHRGRETRIHLRSLRDVTVAAPRTLFPHQEEALRYADARSRIALFMEMRLGKTLVTIRWAQKRNLRRVLVLGPLSVLPGWYDELFREGVSPLNLFFLEGPTRDRLALADEIDEGWILCNYEGIVHQPGILKLPWSAIVLDESTRCRNPRAKITKLLLTRTAHINYRVILSGLPDPESPLDFYCQMAFLHGMFLERYNYWAFRQKHFYPEPNGYDWIVKNESRELIKKEVHKLAFVKTRKSAGIGERKVYERRYVDMPVSQRIKYKSLMKDFAFDDLETQWATVKYVWAARMAGGFSPDREHPQLINPAKGQEIIALLEGELRRESVVIWFRFNEELEYVHTLLKEKGITHHCITGATPVGDRHKYAALFQGKKIEAMLMQVQCGKFGLDLSAASTAIYYSNTYDYEARAQSEDRILHMRKHEPLLYIDLVTRGTVDTAVVRTLQDKKITARTFMTRLAANMRADYEAQYSTTRRVYPGDRSTF